jgi:hypothetical protein
MNPETKSPSMWDYKPWWCQPWSILLTGAILVAGSWFLSHRLWLLLGMGGLIGLWWFYFLIYVPRLFVDYSQNQESLPNSRD